MKEVSEERIKEEKRVSKKTFFFYTGIFLVMVGLIYGYFVMMQKSFIWESDGFTQHYLIFKEYISILRNFLQNPMQGFQMWDWTIGLGSDVLASYGYYAVGDPFVYLGLLFPESLSELGYHLLILLRVYFIGISFLVFCRHKKGIGSTGALFGSIIYTFSYYVILNVTRHPFFLMPMIFFPLLCLGIEKIIHKESNALFILVVFVSAISNFYFFYMLTLLVFIYAVIRYFHLYGFKDKKQLLRDIWTALYSYVIGFLMAAILFLPMVWAFLNASRQPGEFAMGLTIYPLQYYIALLNNLFDPRRYLWSVLGFSVFILYVIPMLFLRRKQFGFITTLFCLFIVFLLLPAFGSIMNGFSGPYNRWTFAFPFFLALGSSILYDQRFHLTKKEIKVMGFSFILLVILTVLNLSIEPSRVTYLVLLGFAAGMLFLFVAAYILQKKRSLTKKDKTIFSTAFFLLVLSNLVFNAMEYYYPFGQDTMDELLDYGTADEDYLNVFGGVEEWIPEVKAENVFRIGNTSRDNHVRNQMILLDRMGVNSYLSITKGEVADFARQIETGQFQLIQPVRNGIDDRRIANNLLGVRYIVTEAENEQYLATGYEVVYREEKKDQEFIVAQTQENYPFAYTQQTYLSKEEFERLNPIEKEVFLSYGVLLNSNDVNIETLTPFDRTESQLNVREINAKMTSEDSQKVTIHTSGITVHDREGRMSLEVENPEELKNAEVSIYLEGLHFDPEPNATLMRTPDSYTARATIDERTKSIHQSDTFSFSSYIHRDSMLFHFGFQNETPNTIELQMDGVGEFTIEDITLFVLPEDDTYEERVSQKWENALDIDVFENEIVSGTSVQDEPGILTTSIPYSEGWKAEINGQEVETIRVNEGFIGVPVESGSSRVTFTYKTPFLITGSIVSFSGFIIFVLNQLYKRKKESK